VIIYPGHGLTRRSRIAAGLVQVIKTIASGLRMRVTSVENIEIADAVEYDTTQDATVEGIPRP